MAATVFRSTGFWVGSLTTDSARKIGIAAGSSRTGARVLLPKGCAGRSFSSSSAPSPRAEDPWRVAIVGSGPSGCYTAKYLLQGAGPSSAGSKHRSPCPTIFHIDVIERLPTLYGLVRNGVAPDHPEVKNVQKDFDALFGERKEKQQQQQQQAGEPEATETESHRVRFFGNVTVGGSIGGAGTDADAGACEKVRAEGVALAELRKLYDVVVLAYGCESDRELDLPVDVKGEGPSTTGDKGHRPGGVLSARQFVNWYNGHPDFGWVTEEVRSALWGTSGSGNNDGGTGGNPQQPQPQPQQQKQQSIVVIGHGNVALDCARILAKSRSSLDPTDLTTRAMDVLRPLGEPSSVHRKVSIVGRRGHVQGAFTIKEVRELTKLRETEAQAFAEATSERTETATESETEPFRRHDASFVVRSDELEMGMTETSREELTRPKTRIHKLLTDHSAVSQKEQEQEQHQQQQQQQHQQQPGEADNAHDTTEVHLRFLMNPVRYEAVSTGAPTPSSPPRLSSVVCERTELVGDAPGAQAASGTGASEHLAADLCLVSIGYRGLPIDDRTAESFDDKRGVLRNDHGRLLGGKDEEKPDAVSSLAPLYVSGWLKRGPTGIIGTNIGDARDTVASILSDMEAGAVSRRSRSENAKSHSLRDLLDDRGVEYVDWEGYRAIEEREAEDHRKRHPEQPREKLVDRGDLLEAARNATGC